MLAYSFGIILNLFEEVEFFKDILCEYFFLRPTFEVLEANLMISLLIIFWKKVTVRNIQRV